MQGIYAHNGNVAVGGNANFPPVRIAAITDGTSNTLMYGEHAHSKIAQSEADWFCAQLVDIGRPERYKHLVDLPTQFLFE